MRKLWSLLKRSLANIIRHPRWLVEIGCVITAALIWFAGPYVGLSSVELRVKAIIALSVFRLMANLIGYMLAQRQADKLEASLQRQAETQLAKARPDRKEEITAVRSQFEKAINALKGSKLARGRRGKAALYALPWYMFIGPPAAGKSTALRHSGLQFPLLGVTGQELQGVGGTRNCDWWFTNEAVLLDTAGRYVTQDEDQEEWLGFLDLLKKYRKRRPINGVLAAISVADLLQASDEEIASDAKKIRGRIDELITRLGTLFPVYVIFTKCDLVQGFVEFFEDLSRDEREQIWGSTLSLQASAEQPATERFRGEFRRLLASLRERRLPRLTQMRGTQKINVFGFPLQLASAEEKLAKFIGVLFERNPYQENPVFRGFYFTSGTQEGTPIDRILSAVSRASGLPEAGSASLVPAEKKSYFLKDLFTTVIFPDQVLAGPSSAMYKQRGMARVAVFALAVLIVGVSVAGLVVSFLGNKRLLSGTLSAALNAPPQGFVDQPSAEANIEYMDGLVTRVAQLHRYETEGVPTRLWGLYEGDELYPYVRALYLRHFNRLFLTPTRQYAEDTLLRFATGMDGGPGSESSDRSYNTLKAYVMLGDPNRLDPSFLRNWLSTLWTAQFQPVYGDRPVPKWLQQELDGQMGFFSRHLARDTADPSKLDRRLVRAVQDRLRQVPLHERAYAVARQQVLSDANAYTLDVALDGRTPGVLVSEYTFPDLYTYRGYSNTFKDVVERVVQDAAREGWVIGEPDPDTSRLADRVTALYYDEYVAHWRAFLRSLQIRPTVTPVTTAELLKQFSQPDSPLVRVIEAVDRNTVPQPKHMARLEEAAGGLFDQFKERFGLGASEAKVDVEAVRSQVPPSDFARHVSTKFGSLHKLIQEPKVEGALPLLGQYREEVGKVHAVFQSVLRANGHSREALVLARSIVTGEPNDLTQAVRMTESILQNLESDTQDLVLQVFFEPLVRSMRAVMKRAKADLDRKWEVEVHKACQRDIAPRYPFELVGQDAPLIDVIGFLHPRDGTLWKFYETELKPFVIEAQLSR